MKWPALEGEVGKPQLHRNGLNPALLTKIDAYLVFECDCQLGHHPNEFSPCPIRGTFPYYTDVLPYKGKILEILYILYIGLCIVRDVFNVLFWTE